MTTTFQALGITQPILSALEKNGFDKPTPIQAQTIPVLLKGEKDLVAQAQTGTGKTAAFGLPMLQRLSGREGHVQALILTPTRELCLQIYTQLNLLKGDKDIQIGAIYGGDSIEKQAKMLRSGLDIVVGTPGRVIDHLERKRLVLTQLSYLVLDEADEMLTIGFLDDVEKIMQQTPKDKTTLLFSATMPEHILKLAKTYMRDYDIIKVASTEASNALTTQTYFMVKESDKLNLLRRVMDSVEEFYGFIFCRTKRDVDMIADKLIKLGYEAEALHGDLSQNQRERVLAKFRSKQCSILVVTDVAARGIDVSNLTHVVNFAIPQDAETYTHRIGRTGRAGKSGVAMTFVSPSEIRKWSVLTRYLKAPVKKGDVPAPEDIVSLKKQAIVVAVSDMKVSEISGAYFDVAKTLLANGDATEQIAKLLKKAYPSALDPKQFLPVATVSDRDRYDSRGSDRGDRGGDRRGSGKKRGSVRLMIKKGKRDNVGPKRLIQEISRVSRVPDRFIDDLEINESSSYFYTSEQDAERIIRAFQGNRRDSLVSRA